MTTASPDPLARYICNRDMPLEHGLAFEDLLERMPRYETDREIPPLRKPDFTEHARRYITAQFVYAAGRCAVAHSPIALWLFDGGIRQIIPLCGEAEDASRILAGLLSHGKRGAFVVWVDGTATAFAVILRRYMDGILEAGYELELAAGTSDVRWLRLRKDKHAWFWCDFHAVSGFTVNNWRKLWPAELSMPPGRRLTPVTAWHALAGLQRMLLLHFGVGLRPTLAGASVPALARWLPNKLWLWKPPALLVALCRIAYAYRGGYCYAERYRGPTIKYDVNRMYSWALSQPLPARVSFGRGGGDVRRHPGIYVCTIHGRGRMPAYVPVFNAHARVWRKRYVTRGAFTSALCTAEIAGLRRLGWRVTIGYGYCFNETFTLSGYAKHCEGLLREYGRGSAEAILARMLANMAYGKLASAPQHEEARYAAARPGADWAPMLNARGEEFPKLWQRSATAYYAAQHVEVAATITARGRGRLYQGFSAVLRAGGTVVYADTDSIIATPCAPATLPVSDTRIGSFRCEGSDADGIVLARKQYAHGGEARLSGYARADRATVEALVLAG